MIPLICSTNRVGSKAIDTQVEWWFPGAQGEGERWWKLGSCLKCREFQFCEMKSILKIVQQYNIFNANKLCLEMVKTIKFICILPQLKF